MFLNEIFCTQIKSSSVIQSWFKSNHDLDLSITDSYLYYLFGVLSGDAVGDQIEESVNCHLVYVSCSHHYFHHIDDDASQTSFIASSVFPARYAPVWYWNWNQWAIYYYWIVHKVQEKEHTYRHKIKTEIKPNDDLGNQPVHKPVIKHVISSILNRSEQITF